MAALSPGHFTPRKDPLPIVQEAGRCFGAGLDEKGKSRPPSGFDLRRDFIKMGFREICFEHGNGIELAQDRVHCWTLVLAVVDIQFCSQRFCRNM